ncbi:hypothetical protein C7446_2543 [Kushneria sinocarnis]|uniref:Uncharacterized protein n=1 Tax=Kushneria sinocarnis TaxID=595502 RepID=A0A420WUL6_9GAMM|nr:hypothetical protein [Kushneria sinocarnis]RKQ97124.1 hypothetical protein C7446_2543 [Kushneria sinocarnis]
MTTATATRRHRLDNANSQLSRTFIVLRDADRWLVLHEIAEAILERFDKLDSHAAISARIRDLRAKGCTIYRRDHRPEIKGVRPAEYRLISIENGEVSA